MSTASISSYSLSDPQGKLFYYALGRGEDSVLVINTDTLEEEASLELDGEGLLLYNTLLHSDV